MAAPLRMRDLPRRQSRHLANGNGIVHGTALVDP